MADKEYKEQLSVKELISLLTEMPEDAPVWHEGCDCFGAADGVSLKKDGSVCISRCN